MITADLGRAGLLALIPVAALLHVPARWQLCAVAFAVGTRPAGSLVAGALGTIIGIRPTLWIAAIGGLTGFRGCCLHHCQVSGCRPKIPLKRLA